MNARAFSRRYFLETGALLALGGGVAPLLTGRWAAAAEPAGPNKKVLVCIFMRGAVDGLSVVVPYAEPTYHKERPSLALAEPGKSKDAALRLDHRFGLHPRLAALLPLYRAGQLAVVHAVGSPDPTRSHFDAQDYMESGAPGFVSGDGWLNRAMQDNPRPDTGSPVGLRGVAMGVTLPRSFAGSAPTVSMKSVKSFGVSGGESSRRALEHGFGALYAAASDPLSRAGTDALRLVDYVRQRVPRDGAPEHGAQYPKSGAGLLEVARLIKADVGLQFAWIDVGGWDTHTGQGTTEGQLGKRLGELGDSLAAFHADLGQRMKDVVVLTMSEFGRTVAQNGTGGTDHGHGTAMLALGGGVRGGKVYGRWPGLEPHQRFEGRDLAVTTDFRDLFAEVLTKHSGITALDRVFPNHPIEPKAFVGVMR
jgi:uncharacterized protein (DUF1501 family)